MTRRPGAIALLPLFAALCLAGCESSQNPVIPSPPAALPDSVPPASTPANLLARLEATWEFESITEQEELLTSDFRFAFSNGTDPELVNLYGDTWGKDDEIASASHLYVGFQDDQGEYRSPAERVNLTWGALSVVDDPDHPDSSAWYKLAVVDGFQAEVDLADDTQFVIHAPHRLLLVRGDAAVLDPGQEARADLWYVRRWIDLSQPLAGPGVMPVVPVTWGRLKAQYR
jgi:hypothetical protein